MHRTVSNKLLKGSTRLGRGLYSGSSSSSGSSHNGTVLRCNGDANLSKLWGNSINKNNNLVNFSPTRQILVRSFANLQGGSNDGAIAADQEAKIAAVRKKLERAKMMKDVESKVGKATTSDDSKIKSERAANMRSAFFWGTPFVMFSVLSAWVVGKALHGRLTEREAAYGRTSQSIRQAKVELEQEEMMDRLNKITAQDFDNTKRIKRPHEILEERMKERKRRNAWHRRLYRYVFNVKEEAA